MQNEPQVQQPLSPDLILTIKRAFLFKIFSKPERQTGNSTQDIKNSFILSMTISPSEPFHPSLL